MQGMKAPAYFSHKPRKHQYGYTHHNQCNRYKPYQDAWFDDDRHAPGIFSAGQKPSTEDFHTFPLLFIKMELL